MARALAHGLASFGCAAVGLALGATLVSSSCAGRRAPAQAAASDSIPSPALRIVVDPHLAPPLESKLTLEQGSLVYPSDSVLFYRFPPDDGVAYLRVQPMEANWGPAELSLLFRNERFDNAATLEVNMEWLLCSVVAQAVRREHPEIDLVGDSCLTTPRHGELEGLVTVNTLDFSATNEWVMQLDVRTTFEVLDERCRIFGSVVMRDGDASTDR